MRKDSSKNRYIKLDRLSDVLALIQVPALDEYAHRSESGLAEKLQRAPSSAKNWAEVASEHPEFFRVAAGETLRVSLVARHVAPKGGDGAAILPADYAGRLMQLAVELHDRQLRRAQAWHVYIPVVVAATAGVFTLFGIVLRDWFKQMPPA